MKVKSSTNKKMKNLKHLLFCAILFLASTNSLSYADEVSINDTLLKAISTNPEIQAKWHSFLAAEKEVVAAKGGFLPRLDLTAGIGRENLDGKGYEGRDYLYYTRDGVSLSLTQMIFDGGYTSSKVKRFNQAQQMRYFDLVSSMEQIALSAIRSHEDIQRYRTLVEMAKRNVERHQEIRGKVEKRAQAGADSQVNLQTAQGRLALALVNLMTEESNLHDSDTQYVRIVGESPANSLEKTVININLPEDIDSAMEQIYVDNPQISSYESRIKSMNYAVNEQKSKMSPRLDLRGSTNFDNKVDGVEGRKDKALVELLFRYNLYNGGSDKASIESFEELVKESQELKSKAEREVKQIALVSYNDIKTLSKQLESLDQHRRFADQTRIVYEKQFEAGRRTLLDLLDSENEYFQANRAYANAQANLLIAKARYLVASGRLLRYFDVFGDKLPSAQEIREEIAKDKKDKEI